MLRTNTKRKVHIYLFIIPAISAYFTQAKSCVRVKKEKDSKRKYTQKINSSTRWLAGSRL